MSHNSTQAFIESNAYAPKLDNKIFAALAERPYSLKAIVAHLKQKHQTVSARLSLIHDQGYLFLNTNGRYELTPQDRIEVVATQRADAKYRKWEKKGEEHGWFMKRLEAVFNKVAAEQNPVNNNSKQLSILDDIQERNIG